MWMFLLILMLPSPCPLEKIENDPFSHTTTVVGRSVKCFQYAVMKGHVLDVKYRVKNMEQNTEETTTINFSLFDYQKFINRKRTNRKSGNIQGTSAGDYKICFENIIQDTKYVEFEVTMEREV